MNTVMGCGDERRVSGHVADARGFSVSLDTGLSCAENLSALTPRHLPRHQRNDVVYDYLQHTAILPAGQYLGIPRSDSASQRLPLDIEDSYHQTTIQLAPTRHRVSPTGN